MSKFSPVNTIYAWRLLSKELRSAVAPKHRICNPSFSPVSLHMSATTLSSVFSAPDAEATSELRSRLRSFLCSNGFGQHAEGLRSRRDQAQKDAIYAAISVADGSDNVFGDGSIYPSVYFSSAVWVDPKFNAVDGSHDFNTDTVNYTFRSADFLNSAANFRDEFNSWIRKAYDYPMPKNLIPKESVGADTTFVGGNVLRFFGEWAPELGLELDTTGVGGKGLSEFYMLDGRSMLVPFMTSKEPQWIASYPGFKSLRVPYKKGKDKRHFAIYVFLPDERDGVFELLDKLTTESGFLESHLPKERVAIGEFKVPIKSGTLATNAAGVVWPPLEKRNEPFDPYCFSSFVFIEFAEFADRTEKGRGKEKAAVIESAGSSNGTSVDFVANHAFLYAIRDDESGTVLMIGLVRNPGCICPAFSDPSEHWVPPEKGQLKINCAGNGVGRGGFSAVARDSAGDVIGMMYGAKKCNRPLEIQLKSILSAVQLGNKLKDEGKHEGPMVLETNHARAVALVFGSDAVNESLEEVDSCEIYCGDEKIADGLAEDFVGGEDYCITLTAKKEIAKEIERLPRNFRERMLKEKIQAGLIASKVQGAGVGCSNVAGSS